jgi:oligopeptide/dipeptide ABC transporter ATP-binding protein
MSELLRIENLEVDFETQRGVLHAVRGVTLSLAEGESLGIVGESGSGKTVMSRATMGLLRGKRVKRRGSVRFKGEELLTLSAKQIREYWGTKISMVFQDPMTALNPVRRVHSQMTEAMVKRLGMPKDKAEARALELLELVRIPDPKAVLEKYPHQLSGGMRQRVMIAMAIACDPKLLFADEPTTALDVTVQAQILELISDLRKRLGMSMVIVTHDLGVVAMHTDRVAVMYGGEVVELATTKDLFTSTKMPYTEALMKSIPRIDMVPGQRLPAIAGSPPDPVEERVGCGFAPRCQYATEQCRTSRPELVDAGNGHMYRCFHPIGGA